MNIKTQASSPCPLCRKQEVVARAERHIGALVYPMPTTICKVRRPPLVDIRELFQRLHLPNLRVSGVQGQESWLPSYLEIFTAV